jgi:alkanesulfonate monooxygenase SsuD/methylene tetrahydromethanopterin reductase-like flavin-dependent oxidoreductase (luciferase family)
MPQHEVGHVSCFDHPLAAPAGLRAWNAPSLLQLMATRTERLILVVDVLIPSYRNPLLLASQLALALEVAPGRLARRAEGQPGTR